MGISRWKEASVKKEELKELYKKLNIASIQYFIVDRELRDSKL